MFHVLPNDPLVQAQVVPADAGILDQPPAALRDFRLDCLALGKSLMVAKDNGSRELMGVLAPVQHW